MATLIFITAVIATPAEAEAPDMVVEEPVKMTTVDLINQYDWDTRLAYAIMMGESGGDENAYNPEWHYDRRGNPVCQGSYGLMQIACVHESDPSILFDGEYNIKRAYEIYSSSDWRPWGAYTDKSYLKYY